MMKKWLMLFLCAVILATAACACNQGAENLNGGTTAGSEPEDITDGQKQSENEDDSSADQETDEENETATQVVITPESIHGTFQSDASGITWEVFFSELTDEEKESLTEAQIKYLKEVSLPEFRKMHECLTITFAASKYSLSAKEGVCTFAYDLEKYKEYGIYCYKKEAEILSKMTIEEVAEITGKTAEEMQKELDRSDYFSLADYITANANTTIASLEEMPAEEFSTMLYQATGAFGEEDGKKNITYDYEFKRNDLIVLKNAGEGQLNVSFDGNVIEIKDFSWEDTFRVSIELPRGLKLIRVN